MTNGNGKQRKRPAPKVYGGAVMVGTERKKNEGSGEWKGCGRKKGWRAADSSIIEGNLAAAEKTMASFILPESVILW